MIRENKTISNHLHLKMKYLQHKVHQFDSVKNNTVKNMRRNIEYLKAQATKGIAV